MRILALVTDAFGGHGGIAKFNRDFLTALCAHPNVEEVVALPRLIPDVPGVLPQKLRYASHAARGKLRYTLTVLSTTLRCSDFSLIVCGHVNLLPVASLARLVSRAPLLLVIYGIDAWQPTGSALINRLVNQVDATVSISEFTQKRFWGWAKPECARSFILPCAIDLAQFGVGPKRDFLSKRYGLDGRTTIMTLARLSADERYKGIDEVLELIPILGSSVPKLSYLIVGDGTDRVRLIQKARSLGLSVRDTAGRDPGWDRLADLVQAPKLAESSISDRAPNVVFTGRIRDEEKADHYRLADAFVMPGYGEGFGIVYLEAMACGVPVVGSKVDGSQEALRHGELGILVDPNNPQEIRVGIIESLTRPRGTVPAGLDHFSNPNFVCRVGRILDEVLPPFCGTADRDTSRSGA